MNIQISSGQGPLECQLAVVKMLEALSIEYAPIDILSKQIGEKKDLLFSAQLYLPIQTDCIGTVQWICKSPYRKNHLRKNWYISVQSIDEKPKDSFDETLIRFETFRSSGKGGQHINKTNSAVRAIHIPTGLSAIAQDERSQYQNKAFALRRLHQILSNEQATKLLAQTNKKRRQHFELERGNPVRIYQGLNFERIF